MAWNKLVASAYVQHRVREALGANPAHGAVASLARQVDVKPQTISQLVTGVRGVGPENFDKFAEFWGLSHDGLMAEATAWWNSHPEAHPSGSRIVYDQTTIPRFDNLPGWPAALAQARLAFPRVTEEEWAAAGRRSAEEFPADGILDAELLLKLVENVRAIRGVRRKTEEEVQAEIEAEGEQVAPPVKRKK